MNTSETPKQCLVLAVLCLVGCGYTAKRPFGHQVKTIHLPVFENRTFRRGLEFELATALRRELLTKTPLRIVDRPDADSVLKGEIVQVDQKVLGENILDEPIETRDKVFVDFEWRDLRTGRTLVKARSMVEAAEFIAQRGESFDTAAAEVLRDLAERIVERMAEDW